MRFTLAESTERVVLVAARITKLRDKGGIGGAEAHGQVAAPFIAARATQRWVESEE